MDGDHVVPRARTVLSGTDLRRFHTIIDKAPFRLQVPLGPTAARTFDDVVAWLDRYVTVVSREVDKLHDVDLERARAVTVLRGLRRDIENATSTIGNLDAEIDAGTIEVSRTRLTESGVGE